MAYFHKNSNDGSVILMTCPQDIIKRIILTLDLWSMAQLFRVCTFFGEFSNDPNIWNHKKKTLSDAFMCLCCHTLYYEEDNHDRACSYHPKPVKTPRADAWGTHSPSPQACCGKPDYSLGCTPCRHIPDSSFPNSSDITGPLEYFYREITLESKDICRQILMKARTWALGSMRYVHE